MTRNAIKVAAFLITVIACSDRGLSQTGSLFPSQETNGLKGYTEPFRSIQLSSDETGAIAEMMVAEGDFVQKDQIVAKLDDRIQQSQLESAIHLSESRGRLQVAEHTLAKRTAVTDVIKELQTSGGTSNTEVVRAEMELLIVEAKVTEAKEEIVARELELKRAEIQLDRRWIRAPFAGVVAEIHSEQGEFLSPLHPEILTLVQIEKLLVVFNLPGNKAHAINPGQTVSVTFADGREVEARVYSIGIQTDAESGTIPVKVEIDNSAGELRSGEECSLDL